jgi:SP family galactose:H+ symporter-like MFS transporter
MMRPRIGITFVCALVGVGGFLLGYDIGIISGVLVMDSFQCAFQYNDWQKAYIVTFFGVGCCCGGVSSSFVADAYGRRSSLCVASFLFVLGGLGQVFSTTLPELYTARFVAGVAVGISSAVTPLFNCELAPADRRGMLVTMNQIFMTGGIMVAFWTNYFLQDVAGSFSGWRIAILLQCVPGIFLFLGCLVVPRSPRWLVQQGRIDEARQSLRVLRGDDEQGMQEELREIIADVELERTAHASRFVEFLGGVTLRRVLTGCGLQMFQMLTGINSVMYYGPKIFQACGFNTSNQLLATGGIGVVNFLATFAGFGLMDRFGRRSLLMTGAVGMALSMGTLAALGMANFELGKAVAVSRAFPSLRCGPFWLRFPYVTPVLVNKY